MTKQAELAGCGLTILARTLSQSILEHHGGISPLLPIQIDTFEPFFARL